MPEILLTPDQLSLIQSPPSGRVFVRGPAGSGKTTIGINRLQYLLQQGVPGESILILIPQRTLGLPYAEVLAQPDLPPGGRPTLVTLGGLGQRMIGLFWPLITRPASFAHPKQPPVFLTLETAQYYMARIVIPLLEEEGYFSGITIDRNRLFSQLLDNLNKAAGAGFDYRTTAERLKAAWIGEAGQPLVYEQAQECANRFRTFCLEHNLLDFSLQFEVFANHLWPSLLCREYLKSRYQHLIIDNPEEDVPVAHDILREWLPSFESALILLDTDGGYRSFLGADPESALDLEQSCNQSYELSGSFITPAILQNYQLSLSAKINRRGTGGYDPAFAEAVELSHHRFFPEAAKWIAEDIEQQIQQGTPPGEIAILTPFLSDALRFSLLHRLEAHHIPVRTHRPSRSLREEPVTHSLLTLAKLAHPQWQLDCTPQQIRQALLHTIHGMDLVRADLLTQVVKPRQPQQPLKSFDPINPDMQERIGFALGERYEALRKYLEAAATNPMPDLDIFFGRIFGELLSQPGFGFHNDFDAASITARLIESIQKFRLVTDTELKPAGRSVALEYVKMVEAGVIAAQSLQPYEQPVDTVLLAPAYTFLMTNRPVTRQYWLDLGSNGWWERLAQPLTHPYVLTRHWAQNASWTDMHEHVANQKSLARLVSGLIHRCSGQLVLVTVAVNEQGSEQRGPLLQAVQALLRERPELKAVTDV